MTSVGAANVAAVWAANVAYRVNKHNRQHETSGSAKHRQLLCHIRGPAQALALASADRIHEHNRAVLTMTRGGTCDVRGVTDPNPGVCAVILIDKIVPNGLFFNALIKTIIFRYECVIFWILQHRSGVVTCTRELRRNVCGSTKQELGLSGAVFSAFSFLLCHFFLVLHGSAFGVRERLATSHVVFQTDKPP